MVDRGVGTWSSSRTAGTATAPAATRLYSQFFEPFPDLAPTARLGYVGVVWPSMRFSDEPIPDFPGRWPPAASAAAPDVLDKDTRHALLETFPGRATVSTGWPGCWTSSRARKPSWRSSGGWCGCSWRSPPGPQASFGADTLAEGVPQDEPEILVGATATVCGEFAQALARLEAPDGAAEFTMPNPWDGAHELLRQGTYYAMKRRAGTVGERGLGRVVGQLAQTAPGVRVHLVGHSFGGRLVAFALRGLPEGVRTVKSVTLLQGAFSHYAFAARLPHDARAGGVLQGQQNRVNKRMRCACASTSTEYRIAIEGGPARSASGTTCPEVATTVHSLGP